MESTAQRRLGIELCVLLIRSMGGGLAYNGPDKLTIDCTKLMEWWASLSPELAKSVSEDADVLRSCLSHENFFKTIIHHCD